MEKKGLRKNWKNYQLILFIFILNRKVYFFYKGDSILCWLGTLL